MYLVQKIDALEKKSTHNLDALKQLPSDQAKAINNLLLKLKDASREAPNVKDIFKSSLPIMREILNAITNDRGVDTDDGLLSRCYHLLQQDLSDLLETLNDSRDEYKGVKKYLKVLSHRKRVNTICAAIAKIQVKYLRTASSIRGTVTTQGRTTTSVGTMTENTDVEFVSMVMPSSASGTHSATTGISEMEAIKVRDFLRSGNPCRDIETSVELDTTCLVDFLQQEVDDSIHLDDGDYRKQTIKCLLFVAKVHGVVPTSFSSPNAICQGRHPVWGGGFA
ncbi:hypothetical protein BDZ89DRAFT_295630 [Hymenopellis radicata]|nr:hypothetical protein BDZ89DRAFT_295630 [Hymenopellis radicata]